MIDPSDEPPLVERYAQVRPRGLRSAVRHGALSALDLWDRLRHGGGQPLRRVHILNLHHLFPDEEEGFRRLLTWLEGEGFRFLSYGEAVRWVKAGEVPEPAVTFTFDDGLASGRRAGEILAEHGGHACYFVVTSMVGVGDRRRVAEFCARRIHMPPTPFLGWEDAEALLELGHAVGSHTHTHPVVGELEPDQVEEELACSREALVRHLGEARHFSWPYGRFSHFSEEAARAVFAAGFESCASAERGAHPAGRALEPEEVCLRREHCVAGWPLGHMRWFLRKGARSADPSHRTWPAAWSVAPARP